MAAKARCAASGDAMSRGLAVVTAGFLAAAAISLLHRVLGGVVLSSQLLSVLSLCGGFVAGYVLLRRAGSEAAALQTGSRPDPVALGVACVGVLLVFATYWGSETGIGGDYRMHRMYAYQLLNVHDNGESPDHQVEDWSTQRAKALHVETSSPCSGDDDTSVELTVQNS